MKQHAGDTKHGKHSGASRKAKSAQADRDAPVRAGRGTPTELLWEAQHAGGRKPGKHGDSARTGKSAQADHDPWIPFPVRESPTILESRWLGSRLSSWSEPTSALDGADRVRARTLDSDDGPVPPRPRVRQNRRPDWRSLRLCAMNCWRISFVPSENAMTQIVVVSDHTARSLLAAQRLDKATSGALIAFLEHVCKIFGLPGLVCLPEHPHLAEVLSWAERRGILVGTESGVRPGA